MKSSRQYPRVVAVCPAEPGWRTVYDDEGRIIEEPIIGWALVEIEPGATECWAVEARAVNSPGEVWSTIEPAEEASNFVGYAMPGEDVEKPRSKAGLEQAA